MKKRILMVAALIMATNVLASEIKPVLLSCPTLTMPVEAAVTRTQGTVQYRLTVNEKGAVESTSVTGDNVFFREVKSAMNKCKFEPGKPGVYEGTARFTVPEEKNS